MAYKISKYSLFNNRRNTLILVSCITIISIATIVSIFFTRQYIVKQAESRIQDVLQEAEALHYYVQREMHPIMYLLKEEGRMPKEFYSPEILSSSYITRRVFNQFNNIREMNKMPLIKYRMASINPRNKINKADSMESSLILLFNKDSTIKKFTGIVIQHGVKHLYYARPFLRLENNCLKCHGKKEDAPKALSDYYKWDSGFNLKAGEIPAIEIITTPLDAEFKTLSFIGSAILTISVLFIFLIILYSHLSLKNKIINEQKNEIEINLTKLKETQNKLVQSEKMASLGILTAGVAHEINNPLNFISGAYLGFEKFFSNKAPEYKNEVSVLLRGLQTGIKRASEVVQGLNHFSRDSKNYNEDCSLHTIIDNCLLILKNKSKERIEIEKHYWQNDIVIKGNEGKLHQVFINILTNSIHSIEKSGVISIETQKNKNIVSVVIKDSGYGIAKENLSKIIEPFFTTKAPGEGMGLGLSITYNIIKEHNGDIEFESEINNGTTVKLTFKLT